MNLEATYTGGGVTVAVMKAEQSCIRDARSGVFALVPVTARRQLLALHSAQVKPTLLNSSRAVGERERSIMTIDYIARRMMPKSKVISFLFFFFP
jgi:hypothetical protein